MPLLSDTDITTEILSRHGLTADEYTHIQKILGRIPTLTELGIFSVMWSEHCSYKNSILQLKTLPKEGARVLAKAGEENAGVIDVGDGMAIAFKIESHNHPSAVEPYQGAATGVGGILRDIFTMGARPIAALNSLRFGDPSNARVRYLIDGVVRGIGDYGNSFGVPTVAGEVFFDECYTGNPLVNAMAVGLVEGKTLARAIASGVGNPIMIVGSKTGRDGIHGATFASEELSAKSEEKRPSVQIGDPFTEKLLLEATLEIIAQDLIIGIQDMGAAGLTCSSSEMSAKGNCGMRLELSKVPVREAKMTPYEIMLSESQERMLVCVKKGKENAVKAIFDKWGLDCAIIGEVTGDENLTVCWHGEVVAEIPADTLVLGGGAPVYKREQKRPAYLDEITKLDYKSIPMPSDWNATLLKLLASPNLCHKGWVFQQYDSMIRTSTVIGPGADAAVIRLRGTNRALAMKTDCNGRYCYLNPRLGAISAVAECARNIACTGAQPLAVTNCLNFGNPYKPEVYYTFAEAIAGMGEACLALGTPVTGGNVSFYNEDPTRTVFPTPTIGMVGVLDDINHLTTAWFKDSGDQIFLLGETKEEIGASEYLKTIHGQTKGAVPELSLDVEVRLQQTLIAAISKGIVRSAHDCADGGLAIALAECCIMNPDRQTGCFITLQDGIRTDALLFGETQSRVIVSCSAKESGALMDHFGKAGVPVRKIGEVGGDRLMINGLIALEIAKLSDAYYHAFGEFMSRS